MAARQSYWFGPFSLSADERVLLRGSEPVPLPPKVFDTLLLLVRKHGHVVDKDELLKTVWPGTFVGEGSLTQAVFHLRHTLGDDAHGSRYIQTVPRRGYRFKENVKEVLEEAPPGGATTSRTRRRAWLAPLLGLLLLSGIAGWKLGWLGRIGQRASDPVTVTPLTSFPGMEQFPTFSPDGRQVAFTWNGEKEDQFDVYVKPVGAGVPVRLTKDSEPECWLSWSPDGRSIAFLHCSPGTGDGLGASTNEIHVVSLLGGGKRKVGEITLPLDPGNPILAWTQDSKWLVIGDRSPPDVPVTSLFLLSVETGARRRLTQPPPLAQGDFRPAVSRDGRTLAFLRATTVLSGDIFLLSLADDLSPRGEPRQLTHEAAFVSDLQWTADGDEVVYAIERDGSRTLWKASVTGPVSRQPVGSIGSLGFHLAVSGQGNHMAYTAGSPDNDIWRLDLGGGREPVRLISSTQNDMNPQVSPEGKRIVFASQRSGNWEIWACDSDGSNVAQVTALGKSAGSPRWSPDGRQIAFDVSEGGNDDIYIVGAGGGDLALVSNFR